MKDSIVNLATAGALEKMIQKESGKWEGDGRRKPSHLEFSHVLLAKGLKFFSLKLYSVLV